MAIVFIDQQIENNLMLNPRTSAPASPAQTDTVCWAYCKPAKLLAYPRGLTVGCGFGWVIR